jgi:hypothetical protein
MNWPHCVGRRFKRHFRLKSSDRIRLAGVSGFGLRHRGGCRDVQFRSLDFIELIWRSAAERRVVSHAFQVLDRPWQTRGCERAHEATRPKFRAIRVGREAECAEHALARLGASEQWMPYRQEMIELQAVVHPSGQRAARHPRNGVRGYACCVVYHLFE